MIKLVVSALLGTVCLGILSLVSYYTQRRQEEN